MKTASSPPRPPTYFYTDDQKVALVPDPDRAAVDLSCRVPRSLAGEWNDVKAVAQPLVGRVALVSAGVVSPALRQALDAAGALHPIYRHGDTTIVVLPEVRVTLEPAQRAALLSTIEQGPVRACVAREEGGEVVLRPTSGRGADALSLANLVHERVHPRIAQARFLRLGRRA